MILRYNIFVNITASRPAASRYRLTVNVTPAQTPSQEVVLSYPFIINGVPIQVNLSDAILQTADQFITDIYENYIDEDRVLRTLLNLGEDRQVVALNWRNGTQTVGGQETLQVKLLQPLADDVAVGTPAFISRELAKTVIDTFKVRFAPQLDDTPFLRPLNTSVKVNTDLGKSLNNVTYKFLQLQTGSLGSADSNSNITFEDQIYRRWYSDDFKSSELNIDFTDYANFVFYGSAAMRLAAFREKLLQIESLEVQRQQFEGNIFTGSLASVGARYIVEQSSKLARDKENLIRAFDRYEQYLYFTPSTVSSSYSASFDYVDGGTEYNPIGYWPKSGSALWSVNSEVATEWYATQSAIAQRFDEFNENNLVNTIPTHIREHADDNGAYITFVAMIGHFFDNIKPYADQFPNIYSRYTNPNEELSKDLVTDIADAVGFPLPTLNSIYNLADTVLGTTEEVPRRDYTVETHKRLLHNLPIFAKSKGTKTALSMLLKTFGLTEQLVRVRELGGDTTDSNVFEEYSTAMVFTSSVPKHIVLPISSSQRNPYPSHLQFEIVPSITQTNTILTGDNTWALHLQPHPENVRLARFELTSGSGQVVLMSSSYFQLNDDRVNIALQTYATTTSSVLTITQVDGNELVMQSVTTSSAVAELWQRTNNVHMGGSGSLVINPYSGLLDEVRVWGKTLSSEVVLNSAFDPGSTAGDLYTDQTNFLYIHIPFNSALTGSIGNSLQNESPYINISNFPSLVNIIVVGPTISSDLYTRYNRTVRQLSPVGGFTTQVTKKVVIADPPEFLPDSVSGNGVKQLSRTSSIVSLGNKPIRRGRNKVIIALSPTDIINQNIIRTLGIENINSILGSPSDLYTDLSKNLETIRQHYSTYYYANVNINNFIRILSNIQSVLNQVVEYFIPSKATLLSGISIEQNLFEIPKLPIVKKLRVYGKGTRKTRDAAGSLTGSNADYEATFNVEQTLDCRPTTPIGLFPSYTSSVDTTDISVGGGVSSQTAAIDAQPPRVLGSDFSYQSASVENIPLTTIDGGVGSYEAELISAYSDVQALNPTQYTEFDLGLANLNKISYNDTNLGSEGAEPYNRVYPRKLFTYEIEKLRVGGITSINPSGLYAIPPSADFEDVGVTTYFNKRTGIYYVSQPFITPKTNRVLNQTWNDELQQFDSVATWSYGERYNYNDVVYQYVDSSDREILGDVVDAARRGNKKYYVFKTRPAYSAPEDGTFYYSGSVPSYIPPSVDRENWQQLFFKRNTKQVPKRVVFDTFIIPTPEQNNYQTTTLDIDRVIDIPERYIDTFSLGLVQANSRSTGTLAVQNIAALFALQASTSNIRIRLYRTSEARDADINRPLLDLNYQNSGVLLDTVISTANTVIPVNTIATLVADEQPPLGELYYTIDNLTSSQKLGITLVIYYFALQIEPRIPRGYLPKHYRYFRDNSTATKRRNWLGCKNTESTTIDGLAPVQIFLGEGTVLAVSQTSEDGQIVTGGGGTLDVT